MLRVEKLFKEKLGNLKTLGKRFEYFLRKFVFLRKIIRMFLKKYQFSLEKLLKRKFLKKFENFKRKNSEF